MRGELNKQAACNAKEAFEAANDILTTTIDYDQISTIAKQTFPENSRNRSLTAPIILHLFIFAAFLKDSLNSVINDFNRLSKILLGQRYATEQAWHQARKRTPITFLANIFRIVVEKFCHSFDSAMRWKGFRVLASDGTCINLAPSKELRNIFGGPTNQNGHCKVQARMSCLVSVFTGLCIDFVVGTYKAAEMALTNILIKGLEATDIILLDRLYHCYGLLGSMIAQKRNFITRARSDIKLRVIKVLGEQDWLCEFKVRSDQRKKYPYAPKIFTARVVRVVPQGLMPVILITSLTNPDFATRQEIAQLYLKRWRIELIYRELKHTLDINNIRSKSYMQVYKEITSQMITNNLIRYAMQEAATKYGKENEKIAILYSFKQAYQAMKKITQIALSKSEINLEKLYDILLQDIVAHKVVIRPGRHYPRPEKRTRHSEKHKGSDWMPVVVMVGANA